MITSLYNEKLKNPTMTLVALVSNQTAKYITVITEFFILNAFILIIVLNNKVYKV